MCHKMRIYIYICRFGSRSKTHARLLVSEWHLQIWMCIFAAAAKNRKRAAKGSRKVWIHLLDYRCMRYGIHAWQLQLQQLHSCNHWTTLGRPVNARFIKRFSHRHSVCLCIFYHVYEGFVVLVLGGVSTPFFMGAKRCLSQFETRDLIEYPFGFFYLFDILQRPSPEASTQASLRDAWQQTAAPEHCVGWFYPAYWCGASGLSLD